MSIVQKRGLDLAEQLLVALLYVWLVVRLWPSDFAGVNWYPLLILPSEGVVALLLLIRRRTDRISTNPIDWSLAAAGTAVVLLIDRGGPPVLGTLGPFLMILGLVIQMGAKLSLWRSFGLVAANRGVRSKGLYSVVRHPMYAGYVVSYVGFLLASPSWWNAAIYACAFGIMIARILAEERILLQDKDYANYRALVLYRLVPGVF